MYVVGDGCGPCGGLVVVDNVATVDGVVFVVAMDDEEAEYERVCKDGRMDES